jgi:hypothetical protein
MDSFSTTEQPISLSQAANFLPKRNGKKPCTRTIERWIRYGRKGVKLEGFQFGAGLCTTREALIRFGKALLAAKSIQRQPSVKRTDKKLEDAKKALTHLGIANRKVKTRK